MTRSRELADGALMAGEGRVPVAYPGRVPVRVALPRRSADLVPHVPCSP